MRRYDQGHPGHRRDVAACQRDFPGLLRPLSQWMTDEGLRLIDSSTFHRHRLYALQQLIERLLMRIFGLFLYLNMVYKNASRMWRRQAD